MIVGAGYGINYETTRQYKYNRPNYIMIVGAGYGINYETTRQYKYTQPCHINKLKNNMI